ncbi:leucyl aminopeptidase [Salidesulfovibrio onnuriiensis]|uniref:leucyl aminopeptidase n=1 Tax=Salidesulfovibrio onnuriiensis TaxID=2583823 RepID=UPI0011C79CE4|nr:leucyl aminopeptidase [Salidesulfovibrio onnuriiensis]
MEIRYLDAHATGWNFKTVILFGFEGESLPETVPALAEEAGWIKDSPALKDFTGKAKETVVLYAPAGSLLRRIIVVGLGKRDRFDLEGLRFSTATAIQRCKALKAESCAVNMENLSRLGEPMSVMAEEIVCAASLSLYSYDEFKTRTEDDDFAIEELTLFSADEDAAREIQAGAERGQAAAKGVIKTRDLGNGPANHVTPTFLARTAQDMGKRYGFKVRVLERKDVLKLGMGAFEAVFKGAQEDPKFIVMEHAPKGTETDRPIVFVGKGITFDTGGISIKPSAKMHEMKCDMCGAGAIFGLFEALGHSDIKRRIVGVMPCTDNMPDGNATRPGDIVRTLSGKTVEIINTDAEGRLILCDALTWAQQEYDTEAVIDLATLTGACVVALGTEVAGVFCDDEALRDQIRDTGKRVGDKFWPLPLWDLYFEPLKSDVSDMMNVGDRMGGASNAAVFLKQFIEENTRWAHLDIAGPADGMKKNPIHMGGASGFAVRTLIEIARNGIEE